MSEAAVKEEQEIVNPLSLSDDELENYKFPDEVQEEEKAVIAEEETEEEEEEEEEEEATSDKEEDKEEEGTEEDKKEDTKPEVVKTAEDDKEDPAKKEETTSKKTPAKSKKTDPHSVDYKTSYEQIMAPFRANGKAMTVTSVAEVRQLMEMGANYNKKMQGLKPNLKIIKMLDNNNLLDEGKLSYLIDLDKKDPKAITKLIKDSGVDPLEVDVEAATDYVPKTYTASDQEVELDGILLELRDTDSYSKTMEIVGNKWDQASKEVLLTHPQLIRVINDQVATGIYDQINTVVERERMLGRFVGVSDLEAYKQIGDAMQKAGNLTQLVAATAPSVITAPKKKKPKTDPALARRKKAAGSTTTASPNTKSNLDNINPLSMSDDDFSKLAMSNFM